MKNSLDFFKKSMVFIVLGFYSLNIQSQDTPIGNKIVGNGDPVNYYIGHFPVSDSDGLDLHWYGGIRFGDRTGSSVMQITNGNVGIGTTTPEAKLDVNGTIQINGGANSFYGFGQASSSKPIDARPNSRYPYVFNWHEGLTFSADSAYGGIRFYNQGYPNMYGTGVMVMSITNNSVGIGTTSPDSKLTVNGTIHATEVKVTTTVPVPDYVFASDYKLRTLQEVEDYINKNRHLPEIPSADEIDKNGLMLAEMNMNLLKKVEELTLYMIEQNKRLETQQKENNVQSKEIEVQSKEIDTLKKENESFKTLSERFSKIENQLNKQN